MTAHRFHWDDLATADLVIDAIYEGGRKGNAGDDPLTKLLGVSNQGGFRHLGKVENPDLVVITTSMSELDWPDSLDEQVGTFTYYGDNRKPGRKLHETPRWGNRMLRDMYSRIHSSGMERKQVPPVLVFQTVGYYRDVRFLGLAVPGVRGLSQTEDLVAIWRSKGGERFQNYRAQLTILDTPEIAREWLDTIRNGGPDFSLAPSVWKKWIENGKYTPLSATPVVKFRTPEEQLPSSREDSLIMEEIRDRFSADSVGFEAFSARICEMLLGNVSQIDVTRPTMDGGRDAVGKYRIGTVGNVIEVDFAVEAKCYSPKNPVGVKEVSRLISRLRFRQFGVLVTSSYVGRQAYQEIKEDMHPVLIVAAQDIANTLRNSGVPDHKSVRYWLDANFPRSEI